MIESLRRGYVEDEDTNNKRGPIGIRTAYEELRYQKLHSKLGPSSGGGSAHSIAEQEVAEIDHYHGKGSVRLVNMDFRLVGQEEIQDGSIDLVLALSFPDQRTSNYEGGKIHEHLMGCAYRWLKEGGLLAMHVEQSLLPRIICSKPAGFQFFRMICVLQQEMIDNKTAGPIGTVTLFDTTEGFNRREYWRPYVLLVKGQRDTEPLVGPNILEVIYSAGDAIDLATALVLTLCPANGSICDPFMGRGTVGDATIKFGQGRKYIGIERDGGLFLYARDIRGSK